MKYVSSLTYSYVQKYYVNSYSINRQVKKIITVFTKLRCISKNVQTINDYLRKPSPERIDPKELDLLLGEITIMHSRAELYIRFLRRRVKVAKAVNLSKTKIARFNDRVIKRER